jgi:tetratricopeptide (TPR) repeat protein
MLTNKNWAIQGFSAFTGLLLLLFCGCQPSGPKALLQGQKYLEDGKYDKALRSFNRAAETMPNFPQVWNHIGLAYHGLNNPAKAAQAYEQALRLDRNLAPARYNYGMLQLEQGRYAEAISELGAFAVLKPGDASGWKQLGKALLRAKRPDDAERALQNALKITPKDPELYNEIGITHMQRKRPREALQAFNSAVALNPSYGPALLNQAILAQEYLNNKKAALERYKAYLATNPRTPDVPQILKLVSELEQELAPKPAVVAQQNPPPTQAAQTNPPAPAQAVATNVASASAVPKQTTIHSNTVAQSSDQTATVKSNPPVQIARVTQPVTNAPVQKQVVSTNVAQVASSSKTNTASAEKPKEAVQPPQPVAETKTNAPVVAEKPPEKPEEEEEPAPPIQVVKVDQEPVFKAPVDVKPETNQAAKVAANSTSGQANASAPEEEPPLFAPRKKEEKSSLVSKINPLHWFQKDESKQGNASEQKPKPVLQPIRTAGPITRPNLDLSTNGPVTGPAKVIARYPYRKDLNFPPGKHDQAQRYFVEGARAHAEKLLPQAISAYQKAIALDPRYFDAYYNLALAAFQSSNLPLALSTGEAAIALNPESVDARYNFALALRDAHYYTDAALELSEVTRRKPEMVKAHFALANIYAQFLEEPSRASDEYAKVLELSPNHPQAAAIRQWLANSK